MTPHADPLEPEELEALLERAERDPSASAELDFLADVAAAAELERARLVARPVAAHAASRAGARRSMLAAAAVLLLLAFGSWLAWRSSRPSRAELAWREAPPYRATELRVPDAADAGFAAAMERYSAADWSAAAAALEGCLAARPEHGPTHFYLAAAREQLGELERAAAHYRHAATVPDALLADHARLRLALVLLARGEREQAHAELVTVRDGGGELASNASELLESLAER